MCVFCRRKCRCANRWRQLRAQLVVRRRCRHLLYIRACTAHGPNASPGRGPWRVLWACKGRETLAINYRGGHSDLLLIEPSRQDNGRLHYFEGYHPLLAAAAAAAAATVSCLIKTIPRALYNEAALEHRAISFVTATDGAFVGVCACGP